MSQDRETQTNSVTENASNSRVTKTPGAIDLREELEVRHPHGRRGPLTQRHVLGVEGRVSHGATMPRGTWFQQITDVPNGMPEGGETSSFPQSINTELGHVPEEIMALHGNTQLLTSGMESLALVGALVTGARNVFTGAEIDLLLPHIETLGYDIQINKHGMGNLIFQVNKVEDDSENIDTRENGLYVKVDGQYHPIHPYHDDPTDPWDEEGMSRILSGSRNNVTYPELIEVMRRTGQSTSVEFAKLHLYRTFHVKLPETDK